MRIVILGAKGIVGTALTERLGGSAHEVLAWGRQELDITALGSSGRFRILREARPDVVINCAAWTDVDGAQTHELEAMDANAQGPGALASVCREIDSHFMHISTDYVFDGTKSAPYIETDPVGPASAYGRTKLEGERAVAKRLPSATIVRTAWIYGANGRNFADTILAKAAKGEPLRVVDDQRGSPTWAFDLAGALVELAALKPAGILHVTNSGATTWFDFARAIVEEGSRRSLCKAASVTPVKSPQFPRPARRPANSVLDNAKYIALAGKPLRPWREALCAFLDLKKRFIRELRG